MKLSIFSGMVFILYTVLIPFSENLTIAGKGKREDQNNENTQLLDKIEKSLNHASEKVKMSPQNACDPSGSSSAYQSPFNIPKGMLESWDPNSQECQDWLRAYKLECGPKGYETAKALLDITKFITTDALFENLQKSINGVLKTLPENEPIVILADLQKSSEWITKSLVLENKPKFPLLFNGREVVLIKGPENDTEHLQGFLKKNYGKYKNFFRFDDAIYSGEQMSRFAKQLKSIDNDEKNFYAFAQLSTEEGRNRILNVAEKNRIKIHVFADPITTIKDQDSKLSARLMDMFGNDYDDYMPSLFFSHKVPDHLSGIEPFLRYGKIVCDDGIDTACDGVAPQFDCIPWITPPYKKDPGYINQAGYCRDPAHSKTSECRKFAKIRSAYLKGECHGWKDAHLSVALEDVQTLKSLATNFPQLMTSKDHEGNTPAHLAVTRNCSECLEIIIRANPSALTIANDNGSTALHLAARKGNLDLLKRFPGEIKTLRPTQSGDNLLHLAVSSGDLKTVKFLYKQNPDLLLEWSLKGYNPGHLALALESRDMVDFFYAQNPKFFSLSGRDENNSAHIVAAFGDLKTLELIDQRDPSALLVKNTYGELPVHIAAANGHLKALKFLIKKNPRSLYEKNSSGNTPAHLAAESGYTKALSILYERNSSPLRMDNKIGKFPIHLATESDHSDVLRFLAKEKPSSFLLKNNDGNTAAHVAAKECHIDTLNVIVETSPQSLLEKNKNDDTPVHLIFDSISPRDPELREKCLQCLKLIALKSPQSFLDQNGAGNTPAHLAILDGEIGILKIIASNAPQSLSVLGYGQDTPAHLAAWYGELDALRMIAKKSHKSFFEKNNKGLTPAFVAADRNQWKTFEYLVETAPEALLERDKWGRTLGNNILALGEMDLFWKMVDYMPDLLFLPDSKGNTPFHILVKPDGNTHVHSQMLQHAGGISEFLNDNVISHLKKLPEDKKRHLFCLENKAGLTIASSAAPSIKKILESNFKEYLSSTCSEKFKSLSTNGLKQEISSKVRAKSVYNAIKNKDREQIETIANLDPDSFSVLHKKSGTGGHLAVKNRSFAELELIAQHAPASLSVRNSMGWTPLHLAAHLGYLDEFKMMAKYAPEALLVKNNESLTPEEILKANQSKSAIASISRSVSHPEFVKQLFLGMPSIESSLANIVTDRVVSYTKADGQKVNVNLKMNFKKNRKWGKDHSLIHEKCDPSTLPHGLYNFLVLETGETVCAEIKTSWEIGSKHASLAKGRVHGAGELRIDRNGAMSYNIDSGTFTYPICSWYHGAATEEQCLANIREKFKILFDPDGTKKLTYQEDAFPRRDPLESEVLEYCRDHQFKADNPKICH
jgi:ankyrin repeat protein